MKESEIEEKLVKGIKGLGGIAYKFVSPGNIGVPDRLIILPGGKIFFIELKAEKGRLSQIQKYQIKRIRSLGAEVLVVRGSIGVTALLDACRDYMGEGQER